MTQGERIREVRKALGLTLEKFGEKIGMKKNSVSQLENGKNSVTEQVVKAICREYIDRIMAGEDEARKSLFKFMLELSDEDIAALDRLMKKAIEFTQNNKEKD